MKSFLYCWCFFTAQNHICTAPVTRKNPAKEREKEETNEKNQPRKQRKAKPYWELTNNARGEGSDGGPGKNLKEVVGAGDEVKAIAPGDLPLGAAGSAEVAQDQVGLEVGELSELEKEIKKKAKMRERKRGGVS